MKQFLIIIISIFIISFTSISLNAQDSIVVGSERLELLYSKLKDKRVGLVVNQSSIVGKNKTHLVDTLLSMGINVKAVFAPEHGFRGDLDAGERFKSKDATKKEPYNIYSLYGKTYKPTKSMLDSIDIILYDIQDVGVRFFTYISTLHYVMEAAAENNINVIVADRPNPNDYIDGAILEDDARSFIGLDPIPVVYGLTVGELAMMMNGEGFLKNKVKANLEVISCLNYKHGDEYSLPVPASPNLRSDDAVRLYPSLCFFEPSIMSVGRGTMDPFTEIAYPNKGFGEYRYTPQSIKGMAKNPKHQSKKCYGKDYRKDITKREFSLRPLIEMNKKAKELGLTLISGRRTFELLAGNRRLLSQIERGLSEDEIKATWQKDLDKYKEIRKKYLLYEDYK